jgi:hypothetical protein
MIKLLPNLEKLNSQSTTWSDFFPKQFSTKISSKVDNLPFLVLSKHVKKKNSQVSPGTKIENESTYILVPGTNIEK